MGIVFGLERWDRIKKTYGAWWRGELDRPVVQVYFYGAEPDRPEPDLPEYPFTAKYDISVPPEAIVDRWDYNLSRQRFAGDAFPRVWPNFGPGVMAAFMGGVLENAEDTVWFHPAGNPDIQDLRFSYNPDNHWCRRVKDICAAAIERWQGRVLISMTDLGGNLDILSTFRPGEALLLDLYDAPDEVKRLTWEAHEAWFKYYNDINSCLQPLNPGYSAWAGIYSEDPSYMLQCDFCYMIGPDMFDEYVKPELAASSRRLVNAFYHLDGPGALRHLDALLDIHDLDGIQWVMGAGQPGPLEWIDVYRRIQERGKLFQLVNTDAAVAGIDEIEAVIDRLGTGKGMLARIMAHADEEQEVCQRLSRLGIEP